MSHEAERGEQMQIGFIHSPRLVFSNASQRHCHNTWLWFLLALSLLASFSIGGFAGCSSKKGDDEICPNGRLDPGEECDFGYNANQTICYNVEGHYSCQCSCSIVDCRWNYGPCTDCGNGKIDDGEECDLGGDWGGDFCNGCYGCKIVTNTCGDSHLCGDEECDDGNTIDGDGCSADCQIE